MMLYADIAFSLPSSSLEMSNPMIRMEGRQIKAAKFNRLIHDPSDRRVADAVNSRFASRA